MTYNRSIGGKRAEMHKIQKENLLSALNYSFISLFLRYNQLQMKFTVLFAGALMLGFSVMAQDTSRKREINITSTFKPALKNAAKINFNAAPPITDTTHPRLQYNIPNQNLAFSFTPGTLRPLALMVDTGGKWDNESYVKLGYGSFKTPFIQAGLSLGDGRTAGLNIYAKHVSSQGNILYQDFSHTNVDLNAFYKTNKNLEWDARLGGMQEKYNRYGFEPKTMVFPDDSIAIKYNTWRGRLSLHNINRTEFGLTYAPEIKVSVFNDQLKNSESNSYINLPLEKSLGQEFAVDVALTANLSRYRPNKKSGIANNYFEVSPSVIYKTQNLHVQAGLRPAWDNSQFKLFPNILAEFSTTDKRVGVQLGWTGYLRNSGFESLAGYNPWIWAPAKVYNTMIEERFAGVKGAIGDHFSYGVKLGYNNYKNQPLFINDTFTGKSFIVVNEPNMNVFNFAGEMGYTVGEKFSLISNLTFNQYKPELNAKAWGLLPMEFRTDIKLEVLKDLYVNSTIYAFDGEWALSKEGKKKLAGAFDFSAGLEFRIVKNVKLWAQFNNIFNKEYQRWNQYPVYGINFLGGVVFSFAQKN
jgi:hypothetical protein